MKKSKWKIPLKRSCTALRVLIDRDSSLTAPSWSKGAAEKSLFWLLLASGARAAGSLAGAFPGGRGLSSALLFGGFRFMRLQVSLAFNFLVVRTSGSLAGVWEHFCQWIPSEAGSAFHFSGLNQLEVQNQRRRLTIPNLKDRFFWGAPFGRCGPCCCIAFEPLSVNTTRALDYRGVEPRLPVNVRPGHRQRYTTAPASKLER